MNIFSTVIVIVYVSFLLAGCTNPNNRNDININIGHEQKKESIAQELNKFCSPRSKCPNLWRFLEEKSFGKE